MPNDATTRLLYAILSQKCLKDIDWNRVARDPILAQEITNGHAARMRYSRFKKQMDGTSAPRRSRNTSTATPSPRQRVTKNKSEKGKKVVREDREDEDDEETLCDAERRDMKSETPDLVKLEDGRGGVVRAGHGDRDMSELATPGPVTPRHFSYEGGQSVTPSPHQSFGLDSNPDFMSSFNLSDDAGIYAPYDMGGHSGLSQDMSGVNMGGTLYGEVPNASVVDGGWGQDGGVVVTGTAEGSGACVKREERWEDQYCQGV